MTPESIRFTPISTSSSWPASSSASTPPKSAEPAEPVEPSHRAPLPSENKRKRSLPEAEDSSTQAEKRRRNNIAAAKCRQKKLDRITELEKALAEVQQERDNLKLQLAKREEEIRVYRDLVLERKR
jgi:phage-related minor tail protein